MAESDFTKNLENVETGEETTQEEYEKIMQENKIVISTIVISTEKHLILSKFTHLVEKQKKIYQRIPSFTRGCRTLAATPVPFTRGDVGSCRPS